MGIHKRSIHRTSALNFVSSSYMVPLRGIGGAGGTLDILKVAGIGNPGNADGVDIITNVSAQNTGNGVPCFGTSVCAFYNDGAGTELQDFSLHFTGWNCFGEPTTETLRCTIAAATRTMVNVTGETVDWVLQTRNAWQAITSCVVELHNAEHKTADELYVGFHNGTLAARPRIGLQSRIDRIEEIIGVVALNSGDGTDVDDAWLIANAVNFDPELQTFQCNDLLVDGKTHLLHVTLNPDGFNR